MEEPPPITFTARVSDLRGLVSRRLFSTAIRSRPKMFLNEDLYIFVTASEM